MRLTHIHLKKFDQSRNIDEPVMLFIAIKQTASNRDIRSLLINNMTSLF